MNPRIIVVIFLFTGFVAGAQMNSGFPDNFNAEYHFLQGYQEGTDCLGKTVIFKLKPEYRTILDDHNNALSRYIASLHPTGIARKFPNHKQPVQTHNALGQALTDLSLIYQFSYTENHQLQKVIAEIIATGMVSYAQPLFLDQPMGDDPFRTLWTPNDTSISLQWYLTKIGAITAWDLDTGSSSVIIAVVDGGTNFSHPDLMDNVYYNLADTIDGLDNDNDGYIDNYRGWDVGDGDNNPQYIGAFNSAHGTAMCGLAAGSSNNVAGIAGVSYKCKYMPVKIVHSTYGWSAGYDGIVYAADHGAVVISCSWGGTTPQPYGQDVVNYATINQGAQIIAAAGNSNNTVPFYPASYEGVIAVGGTRSNDSKSGNSSFYEYVDMVSPGETIYETYATGYTNGNGTSDATAVTSGGFGLVQSYFPSYNPHQVGALLVQSAYRVDTMLVNAPYVNKMGSGRMDLYNAFTASGRPYVYFYNRTYSDGADDIILAGDTVNLTGNYVNYLGTSSSLLSGVLTTNSPYVQITDSVTLLGVMNTMQVNTAFADEFRFLILPGCPANQDILFKVRFFDGGLLNTQYFVITVNPQFYNLRVNGLHTTITNTGKLGFFNNSSTQGIGYRMGGGDNQLLGTYYHPMGFWIGSGGKVSNQSLSASLGGCCPYNNDAHFVEQSPIMHLPSAEIADLELVSHYNDNGAGINRLNIEVTQKTYVWNTTSADSNYIILEYQLQNNDAVGKQDVYAGIFTDFDMPDSLYSLAVNRAYYDTTHTMGVVYNPGGSVYTGIKVISGQPVSYYAFNADGSGGSYTLYDGFSQVEKWGSISGGIVMPQSGLTDVAQFIGVKIDSITPGGCATVVMALLIAADTTALHTVSANCLARYSSSYNIWTGAGGNSNWHDPLNWSKGTVPDFADYVIVPDVRGTNQLSPVISVADGQAANMEIRCGGDVQVINGYHLLVGN